MRFILEDASALTAAVRLIERDDRLSTGQRDVLSWSLTRAGSVLPIDELNQLLIESPYPALATAAAYVLAGTGDMTSLSAFRAGLERPELETRYRSVVGLSRLSTIPGPGYREFMEHPAPSVSYWIGRLDKRLSR